MTLPRHRPSFSVSVAGLFSLLTCLAAIGCDPGLGVPEANRPPTADARVIGMVGQNAVIDFRGAPIEITLDGTNSKDPDGKIKTYRWLSGTKKSGGGMAAAGSGGSAGSAAADEDGGTAPAGGITRWVPAGADENWPEDIAQPKVTLPEGEYVFVLWVIDEKNVTSLPSTLNVTVRMPLDPAVEECTKKVYPETAATCKACICGTSDECRMTRTAESVCDATCWGLLGCIATKCPMYPTNGDTGCLLNNCSPFLSAATGAMMIAPCITTCTAQCRSM
jgi:hypothetical protein